MWLFCLITISPSSFLDSQSYGYHFRYRADYWLIQQEDTDRHKLVTFSPYWNLWLGFYLIQSIIQFIFRSFFFHEIRRDLKQRCRPLQELLDLPGEGPGVKVGEIYKRLGFGFL